MQKSICFITATYPGFKGDHRGCFIKEMVDLLARDGYKISVVVPRIFDTEKEYEEWESEKIYRFRFLSKNKLLVTYKKIPIIRMLSYIISGTLKSLKVTKTNKCKIIHAHWIIPTGLIGVITSKLLHHSLVITAHGSDVAFSLQNLFLKIISNFVLKQAIFVHSVAYHLTEALSVMRTPADKIITFPMSIDEKNFNPLAPKLNLGKYVVISNRNLVPRYNVKLLIKAIPHVLHSLSNVKFIIAGDGLQRQELINLAKRLGIEKLIDFIGKVPHGEMSKYLASSMVFVSTSLAEGTSVSLLEAMACGVFPVVTDIPANREWIKSGENGFLVPVDDEKVLGNRIMEAIRNQNLREKASRKNIELVKNRAVWSKNIEKIKKCYEKVTNESE